MPPRGGNPRPPAPAPKPVANTRTGNNPRGVAIVLPVPKAAPAPQRSTPAYAKAVASAARTRSAAASKPAGGSVVLQIAQALRLRGLRDAAIAGIIGNAKQESSWNPASIGMGGGGLWGFTAPPISLPDLQKFATTQNRSWKDPSVQTDFLLNHMSKGDIKSLNSMKTPAEAATWFMNNWERPAPATQNAARRVEGAKQAYAMLRALPKGQSNPVIGVPGPQRPFRGWIPPGLVFPGPNGGPWGEFNPQVYDTLPKPGPSGTHSHFGPTWLQPILPAYVYRSAKQKKAMQRGYGLQLGDRNSEPAYYPHGLPPHPFV